MKQIVWNAWVAVSALILTGTIIGCKKDNATAPITSTEVTGAVRGVGVTQGPAVTKSIGAAGGSIQSADGHLTITVPAGAVSANTIIGIEPISNTNIAGVGQAFRLTPHGQQFSKPVTISYSYADIKDSISMQEALGMSYQDEKGVWNFVGSSTLDTVSKKITYNSKHFSDWTMMPWLILDPHFKVMSEDEEVTINALHYIPLNLCNCDIDQMVFQLGDNAIPVGDPKPLDKKFISNWKLAGPGLMISGSENYADYKAPAAIPIPYTSTVTLTLKSSHQLLLLCNIALVSKDVFEWRFNGGAWQKIDAKLVSLGTTRLGIAYIAGTSTLSMNWPTGVSTMSWGTDETQAHFNYFPVDHASWYNNSFQVSGVDYPSGGGVTMTSMGKVGEYCSGSFTLNPSGLYQVSNGKQVSTAVIEGRFKLKRY